VRVNSGGEPERDDTGLPPVDIEIPDDARELERDMQAYYRELRALRRHRRSTRLRGLLARDSMIVPLLVCSLVFALVAGTLLTLFTATSIDQTNLPGTAGSHGTRSSAGASTPAASGGGTSTAPSARAGSMLTPAPGTLVDASVLVNGQIVTLTSLRSAVLMIVPANCQCDAKVLSLYHLASKAGARTYAVDIEGKTPLDSKLTSQLSGRVVPAVDDNGELVSLETNGLTAVLVSPSGTVQYAQMLQTSKRLTAIVRQADL
jgi:hypothetical protein